MINSLLLSLIVSGSPKLTPGLSKLDFQFATENRECVVTLPQAINSGKKLPLVILIHGFTGNARNIMSYSGFEKLAQREGFILMAPEGYGKPQAWNCGFINLGRAGVDDLGYFGELLKRAKSEYPVDPKRIYVCGHSNGAMMSAALGGKYSETIAAIGAASGLVASGRTKPTYVDVPKRPVSAIFVHGTADNVVAYDPKDQALVAGISAPDAAKWWASKVGIKSPPVVTKLTNYSHTSYVGARASVSFYSLIGWKHDWSNSAGPINTAEVMWKFFKANPKR